MTCFAHHAEFIFGTLAESSDSEELVFDSFVHRILEDGSTEFADNTGKS